jgi:hypothetical protein
MTETDLSTWLVTMEAAMRIGCSTRTVERLGRAKKLEQRLRPQKGSPPVVVYNPDDVARLAAERQPAPAPFVLPPGVKAVDLTGGNGTGHAKSLTETPGSFLQTLPVGDDPIRQLFAAALRAVLSPPSPPVAERLAETKLFLTIPEAAVVSGFSRAYLRRKCQNGWPAAIKDGAWKIRRKDLEAL